jgi:hypothetical protein
MFAAAGGNLDNAVGFGLREAGQGRVGGLHAGDIDGRVGVLVLVRRFQHLHIGLVVDDRHIHSLGVRP